MESDLISDAPREALLPVLETGKQSHRPVRSLRGPASQSSALRQTSPPEKKVGRHRSRLSSSTPAKGPDNPRRTGLREGTLATSHELSERLTAIINYLAFLQCSHAHAAVRRVGPVQAEVLEKVAAQAALAGAAMNRLRRLLDDRPAEAKASIQTAPIYRVRFCNEFARAAGVVKACQRTVLIRSARSRERAVEAAKKRFARLEGIRNWSIHAQIIEVETIEAQ
jgi:hypothetical protein